MHTRPAGAGVDVQLYLSIGCHGSPMDASCREVWVTEISSRLQNDMASWLLATLILHQTWHVEPCMMSSKREHMKPYEGKHETLQCCPRRFLLVDERGTVLEQSLLE